MTTDTESEVEILEDLEFAPPCDAPGCDAGAEWIFTVHGFPCCTGRHLLCSACLELHRRFFATAMFARCKRHDSIASTDEIRIEAEPLNPR